MASSNHCTKLLQTHDGINHHYTIFTDTANCMNTFKQMMCSGVCSEHGATAFPVSNTVTTSELQKIRMLLDVEVSICGG